MNSNLKLARFETFGKEFIPESIYDWNTRGGVVVI